MSDRYEPWNSPFTNDAERKACERLVEDPCEHQGHVEDVRNAARRAFATIDKLEGELLDAKAYARDMDSWRLRVEKERDAFRKDLDEALRERNKARREAERVRGLREWCSSCGEVREIHDEYGCDEFEASGCFQETFGDVHFPWEGP